MEVNAVIALMRSHQFNKAEEVLAKCGKKCHPAIVGLRIFFLLRQKKYTEALASLENRDDPFSVFLRVHIY